MTARLKALWAALRARVGKTSWRSLAADAVGLVGLACVVHGISLVSRPAAWIAAGVPAVIFAFAFASIRKAAAT